MPPSMKRPRPPPKQTRIRELEREAARRHLNGNGMNGNLPSLPSDNDGGVGTLFGHPYGALPYGNIHLDGSSISRGFHPDHVRRSGLGPLLCVLNDDQLLEILSFVDGSTLASGIVACSRFLYVMAHHEELWRDLTLRIWGEVGFIVPHPTEHREEDNDGNTINLEKNCHVKKYHRGGCWKDIYAFNHYKIHHQLQSTNHPKRHRPIAIQGIYSDTVYRSWLCRSFALQPSWLSTHTVPTMSHSKITASLFLEQYEQTNTPLLIKGASASWPALRKWNSNYLIEITRGRTFRATSGAAPLPAQFDMENYFNYCGSATEEAPLYLFDRTFASKCPQLLEDFEDDLNKSCPFWSYESEFGHDLFGVMGEERRPDHQWLIIGPTRSGSCFHIDPNCTHAWNAPIIGSKRWIFYPPGVTPPGVYPSPSGDDVCMPISLGEWFLTFWDAHAERRMDPDPRRRPLECTACPGDVLFVPHGWWHLVLNIGDADTDCLDDRGISVALTRNYVSASNLPDVLRFLDTRVSQISGCRDRDGAIQPEDLGVEFRTALMEVPHCHESAEEKKVCDDSCVDVLKKGRWNDLLVKAEEESKLGWRCAAWTDKTPGIDHSCEQFKEKNKALGTSILDRAKRSLNNDSSTSKRAQASFSFSFL